MNLMSYMFLYEFSRVFNSRAHAILCSCNYTNLVICLSYGYLMDGLLQLCILYIDSVWLLQEQKVVNKNLMTQFYVICPPIGDKCFWLSFIGSKEVSEHRQIMG